MCLSRTLMWLHNRSICCSWTCLYYRGMCCTWTSQQNRGLHLDMSRFQGPLMHLDMSRFQEPLMHLDMSTPQGPELHLEVSGKQEPVLGWTFLPYRGLNYAWMCLDNRSLCWSGQEDMSNSKPRWLSCTWMRLHYRRPLLHLDNRSLEVCPLRDIRV